MKTLAKLTLTLLILTQIACSNNDDNMISDDIQREQIVYIVGDGSTPSASAAMLWENGTESSLTDGTQFAIASDVFVDGDDVYIAGSERISGGNYVAKYWKNGVEVPVTDGINNAFANAIFVFGDDVYVVGTERNANGTDIAKYWKNGIATSLQTGIHRAVANDIYVTSTDIHIVGLQTDANNTNIATYWKNGTPTLIASQGGGDSSAPAIFVDESDVYIAYNDIENGNNVAKYFKNETLISLTDGSNHSSARDIYVSEGDVYVAGAESNKATYWKNGVAIQLANTDSNLSSFASGIHVVGDDVHVTGSQFFENNVFAVMHWENGQPTRLSVDDGFDIARSIYVVER